MLGTDHMEPSAHTSAAIAYANEHLPDSQVIHSTLPCYIESVKAQIANLGKTIPTVNSELRACDRSPLLPGVLSTRMWIKQHNQHSQTLLEKWSEPFSVFAENMIPSEGKLTTPEEMASNRIQNVAPIIRQAWRLLMENHPHDSICGCSIDQVHNEMKPRFDQVDQIAEEITHQALQALARAVDTRSDGVFSAVVLFNPFGHTHHDLIEVALNIPEGIASYELIGADKTVIPHEYLGSNNDVLANVLLRKRELRGTIGAITEGRVAGAAIVRVKVSRQGSTVRIEAILDAKSQPNISEWQQAEKDIARYEADPSVIHFHLLARTPQVSKIRFITPDIPALGWRTLWVRTTPAPTSAPAATPNPLINPLLPLALRFAQSDLGAKLLAALGRGNEKKPPFVIENEYYRVEAAPDGTLTVIDKRTNTTFSGLNRFVDGGDAGDEYNFSPPQSDPLSAPKLATVKVFRHQLVPTLEIEYKLYVPAQLSPDRKTRSNKRVIIPITSRISLAPGVPRIDFHTEVDNRARDHRLRVHFRAPFTVDTADYDGHFEVVRRPIRIPEKGKKWVESPRPETHQGAFTSVSNSKVGLTIANRGLPDVEVLGNDGHTEIAVTLLRSVGWLSRDDLPVRQGHAGPAFETPGGQVQGKSVFEYAIIPHQGAWQESLVQATAFQTSLRAIETEIHPGEIPAQGSYISTSPAEFIISAIKAAEDGKGWLVRGYNISSETIQFNLKPLRRFAHAALVNLAEEEVSPLPTAEDGSVVISAAGHKIVSVMFFN
jgi:alpha-mannosidase